METCIEVRQARKLRPLRFMLPKNSSCNKIKEIIELEKSFTEKFKKLLRYRTHFLATELNKAETIVSS